MEKGLLFRLESTPFIDEKEFSIFVQNILIPFLKNIKSYKNINFSLCIPTSQLILLEKIGNTQVIDMIKDLISTDRVELVSTTAFGMDFFPNKQEAFENQICMNEFGLGYFFGEKKGFEGEDAILIKDLNGIILDPAVFDPSVMTIFSEMSYRWVMLDADLLDNTVSGDIFHIKDTEMSLCLSNGENVCSFLINADFDSQDVDAVLSSEDTAFVTISHLLDYSNKGSITVSDIVNKGDIGSLSTEYEQVFEISPKILKFPEDDATISQTYPFWKCNSLDDEVLKNDIAFNYNLFQLQSTKPWLINSKYLNKAKDTLKNLQ